MIKKIQTILFLFLKLLMYAALFFTFFGLFGIYNPWLLHPSRTAAIVAFTFLVVGLVLLNAYGGYDVGKRKSRPIIYSLAISTFLTDLASHLSLCIMNTNEDNNHTFVYEYPWLLMFVMLIQLLLLCIFVYLGNYLYFKINRPEECCIITSMGTQVQELTAKLYTLPKQYHVRYIVNFDDRRIYDLIDSCDTIFLYNVPVFYRAQIIEYCYENGKTLYYNFEICDIVSLGAKPVIIDDKALMHAYKKELSLEQKLIKRLEDLIFSFLGLIITSPIMLACAIAIKLDDRGHVFFKQKRATLGGKIFEVYKFRTMKEEGAVNRSVTKDDDRITRVGKILRKFRIDELPQIINIFKGDMSIVGPRPEMIENVEKYTSALPEFSYRLRVKAGLTGLAQVAGKYNTSPYDKLVMDLMYIEQYSLWLDIKTVLKTVTVFFKADESTEAMENSANDKK